MNPIIFDLDDFCDENNILPQLLELKKILPKLRITLFTIPAKTSLRLLNEVSKYEWIQLAMHGYLHDSNYEFTRLTYLEAYGFIENSYDPKFFVKGFKAPGWQISTECMRAVKDLGFWLAVQYSDGRMEGHPDGPHQPKIPKGMRYYALNEMDGYDTIHGHCTNVCGNGLKEIWDKLIRISLDREFIFIDNLID